MATLDLIPVGVNIADCGRLKTLKYHVGGQFSSQIVRQAGAETTTTEEPRQNSSGFNFTTMASISGSREILGYAETTAIEGSKQSFPMTKFTPEGAVFTAATIEGDCPRGCTGNTHLSLKDMEACLAEAATGNVCRVLGKLRAWGHHKAPQCQVDISREGHVQLNGLALQLPSQTVLSNVEGILRVSSDDILSKSVQKSPGQQTCSYKVEPLLQGWDICALARPASESRVRPKGHRWCEISALSAFLTQARLILSTDDTLETCGRVSEYEYNVTADIAFESLRHAFAIESRVGRCHNACPLQEVMSLSGMYNCFAQVKAAGTYCNLVASIELRGEIIELLCKKETMGKAHAELKGPSMRFPIDVSFLGFEGDLKIHVYDQQRKCSFDTVRFASNICPGNKPRATPNEPLITTETEREVISLKDSTTASLDALFTYGRLGILADGSFDECGDVLGYTLRGKARIEFATNSQGLRMLEFHGSCPEVCHIQDSMSMRQLEQCAAEAEKGKHSTSCFFSVYYIASGSKTAVTCELNRNGTTYTQIEGMSVSPLMTLYKVSGYVQAFVDSPAREEYCAYRFEAHQDICTQDNALQHKSQNQDFPSWNKKADVDQIAYFLRESRPTIAVGEGCGHIVKYKYHVSAILYYQVWDRDPWFLDYDLA